MNCAVRGVVRNAAANAARQRDAVAAWHPSQAVTIAVAPVQGTVQCAGSQAVARHRRQLLACSAVRQGGWAAQVTSGSSWVHACMPAFTSSVGHRSCPGQLRLLHHWQTTCKRTTCHLGVTACGSPALAGEHWDVGPLHAEHSLAAMPPKLMCTHKSYNSLSPHAASRHP